MSTLNRSGTRRAPASALIPNLRHQDRMLKDLGCASIDDLFRDIPEDIQIDGLDLPDGLEEQALIDHLARLAGMNRGPQTGGGGMPVFIGAGVREHYIPAPVRALVLRSEFYTSYTPYQPEVSQGMLQALFEFQSMVGELTGLPVSNVSQYDHATALGEACLVAARSGKGDRFLIPEALAPEKRSVLDNYARGSGLRIETVPFDRATGTLDLAALEPMLGPDVIGLYVETPNLFGLWEPDAPKLKPLLEAHDAGLLVVGADPPSLAVAEGPGSYGADIAIGELGGYGTPISYGGPLVGLFATTLKLARKMPGRVVGLTHDAAGRHGFTLTLQAREQHIRRERATSNICTNQTLAAVAASVYLSLLGGIGFTELALQNEERARDLRRRLLEIDGVHAPFEGATFDAFTLGFDRSYGQVHTSLLARGVHGGYDLADAAPDLGAAAVFGTTEVHSEADHDRLVDTLREVVA